MGETEEGKVNLALVLVVGSLLGVGCAFWLQYAEMILREGLFAAQSALPLPAITCLFVLVLTKALLGKFGLGRYLSRGEILLIYAFLTISVPLASYGLAQQLMAHLSWEFYSAETARLDAVLSFLPKWISPQNKAIFKALYERTIEGSSYSAWVMPVSVWMIFLTALFCSCFCFSVLIERQWMVNERLNFPLVVPALELTGAGGRKLLERPLLTDAMLWLGIMLSVLYNGCAVIRGFYPEFPVPRLTFGLRFEKPPWNATWVLFSYRPVVLGIAYLTPTNLSFSIWVFEVFKHIQRILGSMLGLSSVSGTTLPASTAKFPFHNEQALGAFIFIALVSLWVARRYIVKTLWGLFRTSDGEKGVRWAFAGLGLSALVMAVWLVLSGFWGGAVVVFLVLQLFITVTHARIRAEAGPPLVWIAPYRPDAMMVSMVGTSYFAPASLARLSVFGFLSGGYFSFLMASQLESLKMARESNLRRRDVFIILISALIVGSFAGVWSLLHYWYGYGAQNLNNWPLRTASYSFRSALSYLRFKTGVDPYAMSAVGAGFALTALLAYLRGIFWFFPLHYLGYAISQTPQTHHMWYMFFVAWLVKSVGMRYWGGRFYKRTIPVFLGIIFGQISMLILSNILNSAFGTHIYVSAF